MRLNTRIIFSFIVATFITLCSVPAHATTYTYDALNRLTRVVNDNGNSVDYAYDANGNITSVTKVENGACGSAHGLSLSSAPTTNLCASGSASAVAGSGPWTWSCGAGSGSASCSAYSSNWTFSVTMAGSGSGTVNSAVNGASSNFACSTGTCSTSLPPGSKVDLFATPSTGSLFGGWSIGCTGTGTCTINSLAADTGVTALFTANHKIKIDGTLILPPTIQDAYDDANGGETILMQVHTFVEVLYFDLPKSVKLSGGKDSEFGATIGVTTIQGSFIVKAGRVDVSGVAIR